MPETIFENVGFDRSVVKWEEHLYDLTPVEKHGAVWFKREDKFAPLGYGSINGSKLRQCIWLIRGFVTEKQAKGIVSGSVVGSPQHPMIAAICKHYGIGCLIATPAARIEDHEYLTMARDWGAKFYRTKIGYAKALQATALKLSKRLSRHELLETNITVDERLNSAHRIAAFHEVGSYQVTNLPEHIETIIIPAGSCNSVVSVLTGIIRFKPKNLKRVIMMGIGNYGSKKPQHVQQRLKIVGSIMGFEPDEFFSYAWSAERNSLSIDIMHHDLNGSGFCSYADLMPFQENGISFHPRYEGKVMNYMHDNPDLFGTFQDDKTLFWIIGSGVS
jgi:hypothetical protein